jgi:hypothetical protein
MAYTTRSGKTFSNYQTGKAFDDAEQADATKRPMPGKPESKADDKAPVIRIVIAQSPDGSFTSDDGKDQDSHADLASLIDHLKGRFGSADEPDQDDQPSGSGPGIADSVAAMLQPSK